MSSSDLQSFDRVAHVYDETRGLPPEVAQRIGDGIAALVREISDSPRLLEVGVGTGRIAVPLTAAGVRVAGIDISTKMLAVLLQKRGDIDVMLAEAAHPPLRDGVFDAALFIHILHLVPDARATVLATLPLVRRGGLILQGGDDRTPGMRAQADVVIQKAVVELMGTDIGTWDRHGVVAEMCERMLVEAGARIEHVTLARWTSTTSGKQMLGRLARKDYSNSWRIPDGVLPKVIERVTPQLDELYGGLEREIRFERSFSLTVGRLAGLAGRAHRI
jgi:2-polyprenyl-3-methyl-5-hydroxy-6-metoxy-1,4-benzoquinol methylase